MLIPAPLFLCLPWIADVRIIGASFSIYSASNAAGTYKVDKLAITAGTTPVAYTLNGVEDDMGDTGTNYVLYKTKPTVNMEGVATGTLVNGTNTLYSFRVSADSAGDVAIKQIKLVTTATDSSDITALKLFKGSTDYTTSVTINSAIDVGGTDLKTGALQGADAGASDVYVVFTTEEVIPAGTSQIYYLKATGTTTAVGDSVQTYIASDSTPYNVGATDIARGAAYSTALGNFVWSDKGVGSSHSETSADWIDGYLVRHWEMPSRIH